MAWAAKLRILHGAFVTFLQTQTHVAGIHGNYIEDDGLGVKALRLFAYTAPYCLFIVVVARLAVCSLVSVIYAAVEMPQCASLEGPFCTCHLGNCSCASCGTCNDCSSCVNCNGPMPLRPVPPPMPSDWIEKIAGARMLFSNKQDVQPYAPNLGNGFLGFNLGCGYTHQPGDHKSGVLHVAGVFSGSGTGSRRADVPSVHSCSIIGASSDSYMAPGAPSFAGSALDMEGGIFRQRFALPACDGAVVQQSWYAHRHERSLLIHEIEAITDLVANCTLHIQSCNRESGDMTTNVVQDSQRPRVVRHTAKVAELPSGVRSVVAVAYEPIPETVVLSPSVSRRTFVAVVRTSLEWITGEPTATGRNAIDPAQEATKSWSMYAAANPENLFVSHKRAWSDLWQGRVEISGSAPGVQAIAAAVNSSLMYIYSAMRSDWAYGTSPGGLANNAYKGHSFWDTETWQFPVVAVFHPQLSASLLKYRSDRLSAALERAQQKGYVGAMFPWESGVSGANVCPWGAGAEYEQHITGDVALAFRLRYHLTRDDAWLKDQAWPVVQKCAQFWAGRVCQESTTGNWTVNGVVGPDESAGKVNSNLYTNAVAQQTLLFAEWIRERFNLPRVATSAQNWTSIAEKMFFPVVDGFLDGGSVHPQFTGYKKGQTITQSDVCLLQYPLGLGNVDPVWRNDLKYYEAVTRENGYYTGDSSYSIAWLERGNRSASDDQFRRAFLYMNGLPADRPEGDTGANPFNVWKEEAQTGNNLNFLTGAGGFLQNVLQGYGGLRVLDSGLRFRPLLPPEGVEAVAFKGLRFAGATYNLRYNANVTIVQLVEAGTQSLVVVDAQGKQHDLLLGSALELHAGEPFDVICTETSHTFFV